MPPLSSGQAAVCILGEKLRREGEATMQISGNTEIRLQILDREQLFARYSYDTGGACCACPYYLNSWSCPPNLPDIGSYLEGKEKACLLLLKVSYTKEQLAQAKESMEAAARIREQNYEPAKRELLKALLALEKKLPGSKAAGAGRCTLCESCSRKDRKPCRHPEQRRYSLTAFGLDFASLLEQEFGEQLCWANEGLPEYDMAVAALFI